MDLIWLILKTRNDETGDHKLSRSINLSSAYGVDALPVLGKARQEAKLAVHFGSPLYATTGSV